MTARAASGGERRSATAIADEILALFAAHASAVFRFEGDEMVVVGGSAAPGRQVLTRGTRFPVEPEMLAATCA